VEASGATRIGGTKVPLLSKVGSIINIRSNTRSIVFYYAEEEEEEKNAPLPHKRCY